MAKIIENHSRRRTIRLSTDDVINIVQGYQALVGAGRSYQQTRELLNEQEFFLPEELF